MMDDDTGVQSCRVDGCSRLGNADDEGDCLLHGRVRYGNDVAAIMSHISIVRHDLEARIEPPSPEWVEVAMRLGIDRTEQLYSSGVTTEWALDYAESQQ